MNLPLRPVPLTSFLLSLNGHNFWAAFTGYIRVILDSFIPHTPHSLSAKLLDNKILSKYIQNSAPSNHPTIITQVNVAIILPLTNWNDLVTGLSVSAPPPTFPVHYLHSSQKIPIKEKTHQAYQLKILQWLSDLSSQISVLRDSLPFLHSILPLSLVSLHHQILTTAVSSYLSSFFFF